MAWSIEASTHAPVIPSAVFGRVYRRKLAAEVDAVARLAAGTPPAVPARTVTATERALHGLEREAGVGRWED